MLKHSFAPVAHRRPTPATGARSVGSRRGDAPPQSAGRILVIDDDASMCETLAIVLARRGFTVEWSTVAAAALALLSEREFDVVITDLHMDGMDGIAVCEEVTRSHPGLPVILITAFGTSETAADALRAGAWGFLTKPFDLDLLRTTLTRAVEQHRAGPK